MYEDTAVSIVVIDAWRVYMLDFRIARLQSQLTELFSEGVAFASIHL